MIRKSILALCLLTGITQAATAQKLPKPDHVVIVVMENTSYQTIMKSSSAPYIKSLASDAGNALFTNSFATHHPSQPNYLALFSGSNQGVTNDNLPAKLPFTAPNLGASLLAKGYSFTGYSEAMPSAGYTGEYYAKYARKHSPWINWQGTGTNGVPVASNQPFTSFPADYNQLPTLSFVIPTLDHDMHDPAYSAVGIKNGDDWVKANLDSYIQWAKTHNSLLILTFDEDDNNQNNQVTTIFVGEMVKGGQYSTYMNHYNVLRTLEEMYGLPYAGASSSATAITACWKSQGIVTGVNDMNPSQVPSGGPLVITPNPARERIAFQYHSAAADEITVYLHDDIGRLVRKETYAVQEGINSLVIAENAQLSNAMYIVTVETTAKNKFVQKVLVLSN